MGAHYKYVTEAESRKTQRNVLAMQQSLYISDEVWELITTGAFLIGQRLSFYHLAQPIQNNSLLFGK